MPGCGDSSTVNNVGQHPGQDIEKLTQFLSSLYKKDIVEKPDNFSRGNSMNQHIKRMEKYFDTIGISDSLGKICILLESVDQYTKDELFFEDDYDENAKSYEWHKARLLKLSPEKSNKTLILSDLLKIRQNGTSFSDFILRIKSEIMKAKQGIDKSERNNIAVQIFLNGLDDQSLSHAIKIQTPKCLETAFECVKALKQRSEQASIVDVAQLNKGSSEIQDLHKQVAYLTQVVLALKSSISALQQHRQGDREIRRDIYCTLCRKPGHKIENCYQKHQQQRNLKQITCNRCGKKGHLSRNCFSRSRQVAQMHGTTHSENVDSGSDSCENEADFVTDESQLCMLNENPWQTVMPKKSKKSNVNVWERRKTYPPSIEHDYGYIAGKYHQNSYGKTKNQAALTVHNKQVASKVDNKPLIEGKINNTSCKILLDSGSEVNVVDKEFLLSKLGVDQSMIKPQKKMVRCANGTLMRHCGTVNLDTNLGVKNTKVSFIVAPCIYPSVIVGIRSMKSIGCELNIKRECAVVQGIDLPFAGKIFSHSYVSSKNEQALQYGTGLQKAKK